MRRYLVWSLGFHIAFLAFGAVIAPLRGFSSSPRRDTVISVGLVDFADPGRAKGGAKPPAPEPAKDEVIPRNPAKKEEPEELKKEEKPREEKKPKKTAEKPKPDTTQTASPQLATVDTGIAGSVSEGQGGGDVWGVETGPDVNPYHRQGFATIRGNWRNPAAGREPRLCVIRFVVKRNGEFEDVEIEKKSGSELFDRAALRAVQITGSWPAFPGHWEEDEQIIHLEFQYRP